MKIYIHYLNLDTEYILHITEHIELRIFYIINRKSQELLKEMIYLRFLALYIKKSSLWYIMI